MAKFNISRASEQDTFNSSGLMPDKDRLEFGIAEVKRLNKLPFAPLHDSHQLIEGHRDRERAVAGWRELATQLKYGGPIVWWIGENLGWKDIANLGLCRDWDRLAKSASLVPPTRSGVALFIPRILPEGLGLDAKGQLALLNEVREKIGGKIWQTGFGNAPTTALALLAHLQNLKVGELSPLAERYFRTDSQDKDGERIHMGIHDRELAWHTGSDWDSWHRSDHAVLLSDFIPNEIDSAVPLK